MSAEELFTCIEEKILKEVLKNIDKEKTYLLDAIKDATISRAHKRRIMDQVDSNICFELKTLKRYNSGVLPDIIDPDLYELWEQHKC